MRIFLVVILLLAAFASPAQLHYVCYAAPKPLKIDGIADEPAWKAVPWTSDFLDIEGDAKPRPALRTRVKMLWDKDNLYIYAELQEPDLWGTLHQHDTIIYDDNDFEVFINPDNTTHRYFEYEINALGTEMDLFMNKPYRVKGNALLSWDGGVRDAVHVQGTMNKPGDVDKGWAVEMAIPLSSMLFWGDKTPRDSMQWRINFSRVEWDRDVVAGRYVPRVDAATGRRLPEHNWVWTPQGAVNMHIPSMWGYLQFSARSAVGLTAADTVAFIPPADEEARRNLWMVYDKEMAYHDQHGKYAVSLDELGFPAGFGAYEVKVEATEHQFFVTVSGGKVKVTINQEGLIGN